MSQGDKHYAPIPQPNLYQAQARAPDLINANQPQARGPDLNVRDIRISSPIEGLVPDMNQSQLGPPVPGLDQAQTIVATPGTNVLATAVYNNTALNFTPGVLEDLVTVFAAETIIDWTTFGAGTLGAEVDFLPVGSNLRFTSDNPNYTVLNRIFAPGFDSAIRIDGKVRSEFAGAGTTAGNIWFYSPGGIIAGSNSVFDVGSLVLTTNDIDTTGGLFGPGGEIRFRGIAVGNQNSVPAVQIQNDAQIKALNEGSYLAVVAPRIEQAGKVDVNGSVAYVATEQADLTINSGLFDISIPLGSGTTDANGIVHSGSTTGAASVNNRTDAQAIYMVAVPKNAALTMLVGGSVGYQPADSASIRNGQIVLSSGHNVAVDASGNPTPEITMAAVNESSGNIEFHAGEFTSGVTAALNGALGTNDAGRLNFSDDLSLISAHDFVLKLDGADQLIVGGNMSINAAGDFTMNRDAFSPGGLNAPQNTSGMDIVSSGNIVINAVRIDVGDLTAGGIIDLRSQQDTNFGVGLAETGFTVLAGTNLTFSEANTRSGSIVINADNINGGSIVGGLDGSDAGNDFITVDATGSVAFTGTVGSLDGTRIIVGGDLNIATIQNTDDVFLSAGGDAVVDTLNTSLGSVTLTGTSVQLTNGLVNSNLTLNATTINVADNDTIAIGGFTDFNATGDISIGSIAAGTGLDIDTIGNVTFVEANTQSGNITIDANNVIGGSAVGGLDGSDAGNDFIIINASGNVALTGTVGSLDNTSINAGGDLNIATIQNTDNVFLSAGGDAVVDTLNATVGSATVTGTSVTLNNGDINANLTLNATAGDVAGNGTITLGGFANFDATGDIGFGAITAGTGFHIDSTGGDVNFTAANTRSGDITIDANNITGDSIVGGLDGSDAGNDFVIVNAAGNVTLTGTVGSLDGTTINACGDLDIATVQNTDNVSISTAGTAVVDTLNTSVGSASINGTSVALNNGDINANLTLNAAAGNVVGNGTITLGGFANFDATGDIGFGAITAGTGFDIDSTGGDVNFTAANTRSGDITIDANNITGGSIVGGLDGSDGGNDFVIVNAAGNVTLTGTVGSLDGTTITAGGDLNVDTVQNTDNVSLNAGGAAVVDTLNTSVGSATVTGASVTLNNGDINANLTLNATGGDIAGNGVITIGGLANFDATESIDIGNITSGTIDFDAGQNIFFDSITSPNAISLTAINGTIGRSNGAGNITSGGAINLNGMATDLGTLDGATTIVVTATGAAVVDNAISTTSTNITGGSVTLNSGTIGTDLRLNATDGDITGTGMVGVAGIIDLDATGNIGFGELDAQGGNFTVDAAGNIVFDSAMAAGDLNFNAGGSITGTTITLDPTAGDVDLTGDQGVRMGSITASTADLVSNAGNIIVDNDLIVANGVTANGDNVFLRAAGDLDVIANANTGNIDIEVQGILTTTQVTAAANIVLTSSAGSVFAGGAGTAQQVTANTGSIAIAAENDVVINNRPVSQ